MKGSKLKRGETVIVFEDPISEERQEGEFVPYQCLSVKKFDTFQLERWVGYFYGESDMVLERTIKVML